VSCTISVIFSPTTPGASSSQLVIDDDDTNGPREVPLSGIGVIATPTSTPPGTPTPSPRKTTTPVATQTPIPTQTPAPTPTPSQTPIPTASPTPAPGQPYISFLSLPPFAPQTFVVVVGNSFEINGSGFTAGSKVNFFVATGHGTVNDGPLTPSAKSPTQLTVAVPDSVSLGQGFVAIQVVNTDKGFLTSNPAYALLFGPFIGDVPTITTINSVGLALTSLNPDFAVNNVETVVVPGSFVTLGGMGFDTVNGVAIDLFCACPRGKVGPFFVKPGSFTSTSVSFNLPLSTPTGPGSFVVSNAGTSGTYSKKSNAVSVPIGAQILVASVAEAPARDDTRGATITVNGAGFFPLTVINFFNAQKGGVVNLGGLNADGTPKIPLTLVNDRQFSFIVSSAAAVAGPSYVQALNPPFVPFTSSGNGPGGAFTLK